MFFKKLSSSKMIQINELKIDDFRGFDLNIGGQPLTLKPPPIGRGFKKELIDSGVLLCYNLAGILSPTCCGFISINTTRWDFKLCEMVIKNFSIISVFNFRRRCSFDNDQSDSTSSKSSLLYVSHPTRNYYGF